MVLSRVIGLLAVATVVSAFAPSSRMVRMSLESSSASPLAAASASSSSAGMDRRSFLDLPAFAAAAGVATAVAGGARPALAEVVEGTDLKYTVLAAGQKNGLKPVRGDLCAIRFKGSYNGNAFDDILQAEEPLYFRVGDGRLLKGIETAVVNMPVGAKWELDIPAELAFGQGGRGASPGKPRIPPGARVQYVLELAGLPGKEEDLMEVIGDFN